MAENLTISICSTGYQHSQAQLLSLFSILEPVIGAVGVAFRHNLATGQYARELGNNSVDFQDHELLNFYPGDGSNRKGGIQLSKKGGILCYSIFLDAMLIRSGELNGVHLSLICFRQLALSGEVALFAGFELSIDKHSQNLRDCLQDNIYTSDLLLWAMYPKDWKVAFDPMLMRLTIFDDLSLLEKQRHAT